jgi:hypothetical protein
LFARHALQVAILGQEEGVGRRYELGLLEIGQIYHVCIVVADLEQVVRASLVEDWLGVSLNPPLFLPLLYSVDYFKIEEADIIDVFEECLGLVA